MEADNNHIDMLSSLIAQAQRLGADAADAVLVNSASLSVSYRLGALERLDRSESGSLGLRVFFGRRQAIVSSSDRSPQALRELVERAVAMARIVPEDPFCGLADPSELATRFPDLDIYDSTELKAETLITMAAAAEESAMAIPGITNSDGADAGWGQSRVVLAGSNGFSHSYASSGFSLSVTVIAGTESQGLERDYDFTSAVHFKDLRSPEDIGRKAGTLAVGRLGARKVATQVVPVVYDWRVASGLLSHFLGAINGASVARGTTFLKDKLGKQVFAPGITIVDDPHRQRGSRSRPCDGEGVANTRRNLIENGVLTTWLMDLRSARQLGLRTTGHAGRGVSSPPSPTATNVHMEAGSQTPAELMADIGQGLFVTDLFGMGINGITGDYSLGAAGRWIENGELTYPVNEITIAGNLNDMFAKLVPANDLVLRYGADSPTVRIDGMTIAGR